MVSPCNSIVTWHVVISGFLQNEGQPTGMVGLWRRLRKFSDMETCVELRNWNDNWRQFAELIWRMRPIAGEPDVRVYAYSFGAGWGAMQLARQLKWRGIRVRVMVLSDPVFRSPWLPLRWLSLVRFMFIVVPDNVTSVIWFGQRDKRNLVSTKIESPSWAPPGRPRSEADADRRIEVGRSSSPVHGRSSRIPRRMRGGRQ
jgi:hypothetical protein